ncbi:MAG: hypothetical protein GX808_09500 [Syntrophomonadaceae bacterium]|nr:hypothetical protein [Syntrophomonadaceae bacterium]
MDDNRMNLTNTDYLSDEEEFLDIQTGTVMSREEFIAQINSGKYPGYYVASSLKSKNKQNDLK